jgi:hypothetical protein
MRNLNLSQPNPAPPRFREGYRKSELGVDLRLVFAPGLQQLDLCRLGQLDGNHRIG